MQAQRTVIPIRAARPEDPHTRLEAAGWQRLTILGEPRLSEVTQNYRALGYEVHVEPFKAEADDGGGSDSACSSSGNSGCSSGCRSCFDAGEELGQFFGTVYVRRGSAAPAASELF